MHHRPAPEHARTSSMRSNSRCHTASARLGRECSRVARSWQRISHASSSRASALKPSCAPASPHTHQATELRISFIGSDAPDLKARTVRHQNHAAHAQAMLCCAGLCSGVHLCTICIIATLAQPPMTSVSALQTLGGPLRLPQGAAHHGLPHHISRDRGVLLSLLQKPP